MNQVCECYKQKEQYDCCTGTKWQEECFCKGDKFKCDFYSEVKAEAVFTAKETLLLIPYRIGSKLSYVLRAGLGDWKTGEDFIVEIRQRVGHELETIEDPLIPEGYSIYYFIPAEASGNIDFMV